MGYLSDLKFVVKDFGPLMKRLKGEYKKDSNPRTQVIDKFITFWVIVFCFSVVYKFVGPKAPIEALLSAVYVSMGEAALAMSLRLQITDEKFKSESNTKAFVQFIFVSLLLFVLAV